MVVVVANLLLFVFVCSFVRSVIVRLKKKKRSWEREFEIEPKARIAKAISQFHLLPPQFLKKRTDR